MSDWKPIETYVKDGEPVLTYQPGNYGGFYVVRWWREIHYMNGKPTGFVEEGWSAPNEHISAEFNAYFKPTHWARLERPSE